MKDLLFYLDEFTSVAHDPSATAYDTEGVIMTTPTKSRPIPPPPSVRAGFAKGYTAEVNSPNSSRPRRRTPSGHAPSQTAPIGLVRTLATRRYESDREIDRLMRQPRS